MSSFTCICGAITYEADEPPGSTLVAHTFEEMTRVEAAAAELIASHPALTKDIAELIIGRELNASFTSMFRCPHCRAIGLKEPDADRWTFYRA